MASSLKIVMLLVESDGNNNGDNDGEEGGGNGGATMTMVVDGGTDDNSCGKWASRKLRSDADLCNDLREFVSAVGLPEGHVPSTKELSQHGRKDLANIVRRRGYKLIRELLANSTNTETDGPEKTLTRKQEVTSDCDNELTGQDEKVNDLVEHVPLSTEVLIIDNYCSSTNMDPALNSDDQSCMSIESSTNSCLQEKVSKFIQNGELDTFEDNRSSILNKSGAEESKGYIKMENAIENKSRNLGEECSEHVPTGNNAATMLNGSALTLEPIAPPATGNHSHRDDYSSTEGLIGANSDKDLDVETDERENQVEINHLKFMLHQKELELSRLREQIEKEKLALSILQTKAETEIGKAQKLVLEKDSELHAAEESLLGLEEVQIQYCGDGETVEVAGSFNGWHDQIKMDPQPSSSIIDPIGSRKSRLWSTVLWLYPGIYEIKFIVDGHWRIDPQRESITRDTIHNNILRVDR
ncbi:hypothetical protein L1049_007563 [Liquidambar formosana]|uniref:AMP-activated protein kinase glycogen-binding domain-containing protein n=1 Tax=Liquidambar formosana TaxID=63359 RepID=A0AAP0S512_LIQFO